MPGRPWSPPTPWSGRTTLLASLSATHGLEPRADVTFVDPVNGVTRKVDLISGHRDWLTTDCPGALLHGDLPALSEGVGGTGPRLTPLARHGGGRARRPRSGRRPGRRPVT
ncbi:hypothetical protein ACF05L_33775 [Streptomyces bobili]|uniref:hypothetical protein n=1 Tax=Streptomyces bobili TaxID=67280 RepID=UPI0036F50932